MNFYTTLADYYDHIFPLEMAVVDFTQQSITSASVPAQVLDIGCSTGSLAIELAKKRHTVTGIDLDDKMIQLAQSKAHNVEFLTGDMLNIELLFYKRTFSHILCFGNTLVHLQSQESIESFLSQTFALLGKNGKLLIQILNYDYILSHQSMILPHIETKTLTFHREYKEREDGLLDFNTELTLKNTNTVLSSSVPLLPLQKDDLHTLLQMAGYTDISYYNGFSQKILRTNSFVLVCKARKA